MGRGLLNRLEPFELPEEGDLDADPDKLPDESLGEVPDEFPDKEAFAPF